jgi:hypothetical protein
MQRPYLLKRQASLFRQAIQAENRTFLQHERFPGGKVHGKVSQSDRIGV